MNSFFIYRVSGNYPDFLNFTSFILFFSVNFYPKFYFYSDKMKSLTNLRDAIIRAHERGKKQVEIAEFLGIPSSTVNDAIKRYEETGRSQDRAGRGRKKSARSKKSILRTKGMIKKPHDQKQTRQESWARNSDLERRLHGKFFVKNLG